MKYLYENIDWSNIKYIGFDMDGTLYDEFDFISEVYKDISELLTVESYSFMCQRWLEKGSSYNLIFKEAFELFKRNESIIFQDFLDNALSIYRNFNPSIKLNRRTIEILNYCKTNFEIFLITDGNSLLQKKKFNALKLSNFFDEKKIVFTGDYTKNFEKPNLKALELLNVDTSKTLFFGDRVIDKEFAEKSSMQFQKVYNMIGVYV